MDKRKVLIPMILAIVTLLFVVLGASFAYFTFTATINSSTNTITSKTGGVGNITLTATTPALYISTTAQDFKEGTTGTFWSTTTSGTYANTETKQIINTLKANGGSSDTIYECTYNLNVSTTGLPASGMKTGEYIVYISGVDDKVLDMSDTQNRNKTYTVTRYLTGTTPKTLTSSAKLVSTNSAQNYLQGLTIETTFTTSNLDCSVVQSAGTDSMTEYQAPASYYVYDANGANGAPAALNSPGSSTVYIKGRQETLQYEENIYELLESEDGENWEHATEFSQTEYDSDPSWYEWISCPGGTVEEDGYYYKCVKKVSAGDNYLKDVYDSVCGVFNETEVCMEPNTWDKRGTYKTNFETAGASCTISEEGLNANLQCSLGSVSCRQYGNGNVYCGDNGSTACEFRNTGSGFWECYSSSGQ